MDHIIVQQAQIIPGTDAGLQVVRNPMRVSREASQYGGSSFQRVGVLEAANVICTRNHHHMCSIVGNPAKSGFSSQQS